MSAPFAPSSPHNTPSGWLDARGVSPSDRYAVYERAGASARVAGFTAYGYEGPPQYEVEYIGYCWLRADHPARVIALCEALIERGEI
jgi:hypothetical protein